MFLFELRGRIVSISCDPEPRRTRRRVLEGARRNACGRLSAPPSCDPGRHPGARPSKPIQKTAWPSRFPSCRGGRFTVTPVPTPWIAEGSPPSTMATRRVHSSRGESSIDRRCHHALARTSSRSELRGRGSRCHPCMASLLRQLRRTHVRLSGAWREASMRSVKV